MLKKEIRLIKNIPENWNAYVLSELGEFKNGINKDKSSFGFGVPFVNLMDVFGKSSIANHSFSLVDASEKEQELYNLKAGDILFVRSSVKPEGVGQTCVVIESLKKTVYSGFLIRFRPDSKLINWKYATHCFDGSRFRQRLLVHSTIAANTNINQESLKQLAIHLPPLPEQKAIADLLSTWDEAIEKTERLILVEEKRFKWLLRELISEPQNTQKNTEWKKVKLGEVCKVITSNVDKKTSPDETPVHLCNYMDVYKNYYITQELCFMPASATDGEIEKYQLRVHDVLLTKDSETPDDIANSACVLDAPENLLCGYHLAILRPKNNLFGPYFNFALHTPRIRYEFSRQANGATRFGLTMTAYNMVELPLPPFEEQKAIAEALTASQQEIDLLKQLADKYKTQKRGLMQKMLTGEWRVKPEIVNQYMEA